MAIFISQVAINTDSMLIAVIAAEKALKINKPSGFVKVEGQKIEVSTITYYENNGFQTTTKEPEVINQTIKLW